jgi:hypothetical protein
LTLITFHIATLTLHYAIPHYWWQTLSHYAITIDIIIDISLTSIFD